MKKLLSLAIALISLSTASHAQRVAIFLKNCANLDSLSNAYFALGDEQFLVIDAYKDGLIKNDSFQFRYKESILWLNNKPVPEPYNTRYHNRLLDVAKRQHVEPKDYFMALSHTTSSNNDISVSAPEDEIKKYADEAKKRLSLFATTDMRDSLFITRLLHDGLIHAAKDTRIRYNKFGVWVNNAPLYNSKARKYIPVLEHFTNIPAPGQSQSFAALCLDASDIKRYGMLANQ